MPGTVEISPQPLGAKITYLMRVHLSCSSHAAQEASNEDCARKIQERS